MANTMRTITVKFMAKTGAFVAGVREANSSVKKFNTTVNQFAKETGGAMGGISKLGVKIKQISETFQGWAMSVMFGGMMIQRIFTSIARSGVNSFKEITESAGIAAVNIDGLAAGIKFLGFTVGDAINTFLAPFMPMIFNIVNALGQWINDHPKLTAVIVLAGIAIGALMFAIGSLVLLIVGGLLPVFLFLAEGSIPLAITMFKAFGIFAATAIGMIVVAVAALAVMWIFNFGRIRDFADSLIDGLKKGFMGLFNVLKGIVTGDGTLILAGFNQMAEGILGIFDGMVKFIINFFIDMFSFIITKPQEVFVKLLEIIRGVLVGLGVPEDFFLIRILDFTIEKIKTVIGWITSLKEGLQNLVSGAGGVSGAFSAFKGLLGFATGGTVPGPLGSPQLAVVHGGETISPSGGSGSGTFNITINTSGGVDARQLVQEIKRHMRA